VDYPQSLAGLRCGSCLRRDLLEIGVLRHLGRGTNARHDIADELLGSVVQSVRAVRPNWKVHDLTLHELPLTLGTAQRGTAAQNEQELLRAVVEVVDGGVPRPKLVHGCTELRFAIDKTLRLRSSAGPVVRRVPVIREEIGRVAQAASSLTFGSNPLLEESLRRPRR
jgi:hypothetical protein